jgi:hypothetical protein
MLNWEEEKKQPPIIMKKSSRVRKGRGSSVVVHLRSIDGGLLSSMPANISHILASIFLLPEFYHLPVPPPMTRSFIALLRNHNRHQRAIPKTRVENPLRLH